ncbi:MAG TPA: MMPL family transporter, partial [Spirochaetia bacterium]|nr:MMPL family transporter [Spirochaetia bacterium]
FRDFLLSRDRAATSIYVFLRRDAPVDRLVPAVQQACAAQTRARASVFGQELLRSSVRQSVVPELALLGGLSLLIIFLFEWVATRSLLAGLVLWVTNLLPALWVLSFFPVAGLTLKTETIYAPIVLVALCTSYGLQLYRNLALGPGRGMGDALAEVTPVIFSAGVTCILGFASLAASSIALLRLMGAILVMGIALGVLSSLFLLPTVLAMIPIRRYRRFRRARALLGASRSRWVPVGFALAAAVLAFGTRWISVDYRVQSSIQGRSSLSRTAAQFDARYGGLDTLELIIDSRREYGWVDPVSYERLRSLRAELARVPQVTQVICVTDLVDWVRARLTGSANPPAGLDERQIGESLELLASAQAPVSLDGLLDPSYSITRLVVRFDTRGLGARDSRVALRRLMGALESGARQRFPDAHLIVTGAAATTDRFLTLLVQSQVAGIFVYLLLAFLFVAGFLRSARWALLSLLLPCGGVILYLGLLGWLRVPLTGVTVLTIASIMGVGIDGLLCLITFYRTRRTSMASGPALEDALEASGMAIIQATLIIVLSLLCLLASRYSMFVWTGILTGITFLGCMAVTLLLIPNLALRFERTLQ